MVDVLFLKNNLREYANCYAMVASKRGDFLNVSKFMMITYRAVKIFSILTSSNNNYVIRLKKFRINI